MSTDPAAAPYVQALAVLDLPQWLAWTVRTSTKRRTVGAVVEPGPVATFTIPAGADPAAVVRVAQRIRAKVVRHAAEVRDNGPHICVKQLVSGEGFPFVGKPQRLRLVDDDNRSGDPGQPLTRHPGVPIIAEPGPSTWSGHRTWQLTLRRDAASARTVIEWYRAEGQRWLDQHVPPVAQRMGVTPGLTWRVRPYQEGEGYSRSWGTYRPATHTIALHWMIFQFPRELVDYVVAHEVAHAALRGVKAGHGPRWQAMVSRVVHNWRDLDGPARTARRLTLWAGEVEATADPVPATAEPFVSGWGAIAGGGR